MNFSFPCMKKLLKSFCILSLLFFPALSTLAQDSAAAKNKWKTLAELYMMFPNMKGNAGLGTLPDAPVDMNAADILNRLQMGAMLYVEAANDKWSVNTDIVYMHLEQNVRTGLLISSGEVNIKQLAWELAGLRKFLPWLEAGLGTRLNSLDTKVDMVTNNIIGIINGATTTRSKSITKTWVDPIIITRIKSAAGKKFIYQFRGDIGGFGIGSKFAWQVQAYAGYRFSKLFQLTGGYRVISVDYDKGSGQDRFLYDINTFGPVVRLGFNF
jgi:hypothetical protein